VKTMATDLTRREVAAAGGGVPRGSRRGASRQVAVLQTVDDYLRLPYTVRVTADPTGGFAASVEELPGCVTQAESWAEAGEMARDAMRAWIAAALEDGRRVPIPGEDAEPARILVRVPRSLHRALQRTAAGEGVSLNQYIACVLAEAVGRGERG
jgi:antitoxin HicB